MSKTIETLEQAMGWSDPEPVKPPEPLVPAVLDGTPTLPPPGIYFGMSEEEYHALPALSSHGIRDLASSPMRYWSRTTFLSLIARQREKERRESERIHYVVGKAYHCRIMEGVEEFNRRFAVELTTEECDGALESTDQIKAAIIAAGHKVVAKVEDKMPETQHPYMRAAKKGDWAQQLLEIDPKAKILDIINAEHRAKHAGKMFISAEAYDQIEIAARMIEADPEVRHAFTGGYAEVVLIWFCPTTGVPMKCRIDYLKEKAAVDLKTVANQRGMSMERAIAQEVAAYKYQIQPSVYVEGVQVVSQLVREGKGQFVVYGDKPKDEIYAFVARWARQPECEWLWVFQQKGDAPVTRGVFYPLNGSTKSVTDYQVSQQKEKFRKMSETYGTDPWLDIKPVYDMADEDLPPWTTEI